VKDQPKKSAEPPKQSVEPPKQSVEPPKQPVEAPKQRTAEGPRFGALTPPLRAASLAVLAAQGFERATPVQVPNPQTRQPSSSNT